MTKQQADIELFKREARKVYMQNAPWLAVGAKYDTKATEYTDFKNTIQDKIFAIPAPDIDIKTKVVIIAALEDELDNAIRTNHKKE